MPHIKRVKLLISVKERVRAGERERERGEDECSNPSQESSLKVDEHKQTLFVVQSTLQLISPWLPRRSNRGERNECELSALYRKIAHHSNCSWGHGKNKRRNEKVREEQWESVQKMTGTRRGL